MYYSDSDRREKILEYVRSNPRVTKTQVIKHMKEMSSLVTSHRLITDLIKGGILKVQKDEPRKQTSQRGRNHYLVINDKNVFNAIIKELSEIESSIDLWDKFRSDRDYRKENEKSYIKFHNKFYGDFHYEDILMMLLSHLDASNNNKIIRSENYSKLLTKRIIGLILRLKKQDEPTSYSYELEHAHNWLEYFFNDDGVKKDLTNTKVVDNLKTRIENFLKFRSDFNLWMNDESFTSV